MPGTPNPNQPDVVIVGAGLAGLVAARTLVGAVSGRRCADAVLAAPA